MRGKPPMVYVLESAITSSLELTELKFELRFKLKYNNHKSMGVNFIYFIRTFLPRKSST